jgi:uncharacterized protein (DUF1697 family)
MPTTHIALLRGINVGKAKQIPMAGLRALLEGAGYTDVRTLLRSGNVVLTAASKDPAAVAADVERLIEGQYGFSSRVVVRSRAQVQAVVDRDPFAGVATDGAKYLVGFCAAKPAKGVLDGLDPEVFAPERWVLDGDTLYLWLPGGINDSKLVKATSDKALGVAVTARNWNTVRKLLELAAHG